MQHNLTYPLRKRLNEVLAVEGMSIVGAGISSDMGKNDVRHTFLLGHCDSLETQYFYLTLTVEEISEHAGKPESLLEFVAGKMEEQVVPKAKAWFEKEAVKH